MTRFLLVRHGQTPWNAARRLQGLTDIPLDEVGRAQAEKLGNRLKSETINHVYSSHLLRAKETAQAVAQHHPQAPFTLLEDLAEFGMGVVEGLTIEEAHKRHTPKFWDDDLMRAQLGMELKQTYLDRFQQHINEWLQKHNNETVLLSSHGGKLQSVIRAFELPLADLKILEERHLTNCSLTIIEAEPGKHRLELYSCSTHLVE